MKKLLVFLSLMIPIAASAQPSRNDLMGLRMSAELANVLGKENAPNINVGASGAVVPVLFGTFYKLEDATGAYTGWTSISSGGLNLQATSNIPIRFYTNGTLKYSISSTGVLTQDGTNGGGVTLTKTNTSVAQPAANALTATGTALADALQLSSVYNNVTTAASGTGVKLWNPTVGSTIWVRNGGANNLLLYPADASGAINGGTGGAAITLTTAAKQIAACSYVATNAWMCSIATGG